MARTMIVPAALEYQSSLAGTIDDVKGVGGKVAGTQKLLEKVATLTEDTLDKIEKLEKAIESGKETDKINAMNELRTPVDKLEGLVPDEIWPLPSYAEMLFLM